MTGPGNAALRGEPTGNARQPFEVEATPIGPQSLVPGVAPIRTLDRLIARAAAPLEARKPQRPCDPSPESQNGSGGAVPPGALFDLNARLQLDLFAPAAAPAREPHPESDR